MRLSLQQQREGLALLGISPAQLEAVLRHQSMEQAEKALHDVQKAAARGFKVASLRYHPDRHENATAPVKAENERLFKLANVVNQLVQDLAVKPRPQVIRRPFVPNVSTIHYANSTNTNTTTATYTGSVWRVHISHI